MIVSSLRSCLILPLMMCTAKHSSGDDDKNSTCTPEFCYTGTYFDGCNSCFYYKSSKIVCTNKKDCKPGICNPDSGQKSYVPLWGESCYECSCQGFNSTLHQPQTCSFTPEKGKNCYRNIHDIGKKECENNVKSYRIGCGNTEVGHCIDYEPNTSIDNLQCTPEEYCQMGLRTYNRTFCEYCPCEHGKPTTDNCKKYYPSCVEPEIACKTNFFFTLHDGCTRCKCIDGIPKYDECSSYACPENDPAKQCKTNPNGRYQVDWGHGCFECSCKDYDPKTFQPGTCFYKPHVPGCVRPVYDEVPYRNSSLGKEECSNNAKYWIKDGCNTCACKNGKPTLDNCSNKPCNATDMCKTGVPTYLTSYCYHCDCQQGIATTENCKIFYDHCETLYYEPICKKDPTGGNFQLQDKCTICYCSHMDEVQKYNYSSCDSSECSKTEIAPSKYPSSCSSSSGLYSPDWGLGCIKCSCVGMNGTYDRPVEECVYDRVFPYCQRSFEELGNFECQRGVKKWYNGCSFCTCEKNEKGLMVGKCPTNRDNCVKEAPCKAGSTTYRDKCMICNCDGSGTPTKNCTQDMHCTPSQKAVFQQSGPTNLDPIYQQQLLQQLLNMPGKKKRRRPDASNPDFEPSRLGKIRFKPSRKKRVPWFTENPQVQKFRLHLS